MRTLSIFLISLLTAVFSISAQQTSDPFLPKVTRALSEQVREILDLAEEQPEEAVAGALRLREQQPGPAVDFVLGGLYFGQEKYPEAEQAYRAALEKFPRYRSAGLNLGRIYLLQERADEAAAHFAGMVERGMADSEVWMLLGLALMRGDEPVPAETAFRQAYLLNPANTEALAGLLNSLLRQEKYAEVRSLSRSMLDRDPVRKEYWAARTNAEMALGEADAARVTLEQARRLGLADAEMLAMLGQLYLQGEAPAEGVARFEEAFALGNLSPARQEQAVRGLLELGRLEDAEKLLEEMAAGLSSIPEARREDLEGTVLNLKARLSLRRGEDEEAERRLKRGLERNPLSGELLLMLAELRQEQAREEEAVLILERLTRIRGYEAEALLQMARIKVSRREWASAVELLERAQVFQEKPELGDYLRQLRRMAAASASGGE